MKMAAPQGPTRIIYAKLTSTGAYDVVAKTANVELSVARELAEKVQLGNLPFGVRVGEELGYARLDGSNVVVRYTTYGWSDGRAAPLMTDLVWLDDAAFARVRRNPFVVVPRSDAVFEHLVELPPVELSTESTEDTERERIKQLAAKANDFTTFVAGVLSAESLLIINPDNQANNLELLILLLPPRLRDRVTFQTCAYQAPQQRRRVTVAEAMHANLRQGGWTRVLPDEADSLTLQPANRFSEFLAAPERVQRAHALYERIAAADVSSSLAAEATRLARLADFLPLIDNKLITEALRLVAKAKGSEATVMLEEIGSRFPPQALAEALGALYETRADDAALVRLTELIAAGPAEGASVDALSAALLGSRRDAPPELALLLLGQVAARDTDRAVRLLAAARQPGSAAPSVRVALPAHLAGYAEAQAGNAQTRPLESAAALVRAATQIYGRLQSQDARNQVESDCRSAVGHAVRSVTLGAADVRALRSLQTALDSMGVSWSADLGAAVLSDDAIIGSDRTGSGRTPAEQGKRLGESATPEWAGVICATLLMRVAHAPETDSRSSFADAAHALLAAHADQRLGARVALLLGQLGVSDTDLLEEPAFQQVLPFLGDTAREASLAQSLGSTLGKLFTDQADTAAAELARLVFNARAAHQHLVSGSRGHAAAITALRAARERGLIARYPVQAELALDLLAFASDPNTFRDFESAALGRAEASAIRLRRLDRAVAQAATANDEALYSALAAALESGSNGIDPATRRRLREALGTAGLHRRLLEAFNTVVQR